MNSGLPRGYQVTVDSFTAEAWYDQVRRFSDASLYQVWQQEFASGWFSGVSRLAVNRDSELVAAAEVRLMRLPGVRGGVGYVPWGPLVRPGTEAPANEFGHIVKALRAEYVDRRSMTLRIRPRLYLETDGKLVGTLLEEGFRPVAHVPLRHSLILDLSPGVDGIRAGFEKKWRNCLSKAEKCGLTIQTGTAVEMFDAFEGIYHRMLRRKQFAPSADIAKHRRLQQALPQALKMKVVVARAGDEPCAGAIYSDLGDTGLYLFGATDEVGMRTCASYLVQWRVVQDLKERGLPRYDLNGVDAVQNPGTYHFKRGLAGRNALEVTLAGAFQAAGNALASRCALLTERIQAALRSVAHSHASPRANPTWNRPTSDGE